MVFLKNALGDAIVFVMKHHIDMKIFKLELIEVFNVSTGMFHLLCHQMLIIVIQTCLMWPLKRTLKYNQIRQVLTVYTTGLFVQA
jgi:hypothetical protein